jgi:ABC-type Fe3+/spermidine/putrescine transport system ATPase subunit
MLDKYFDTAGSRVVVSTGEPVMENSSQAGTLQIESLELYYGDFPALLDIDLDVQAGEFIALLGPSGCGKTSLLRSVAGFNIPQNGRIVLNGRDVADSPPRSRNIGIVFQSYALFPHMTALQNVAFGLECRHMPKAKVEERARGALDKVHLGDFADRRPKELSGGQQQRVALARAIVIEPDLLLLDEPLGALDKQLRLKMQYELKELQRSLGITAIFVTHDQEEAVAMADRIVVLRDGRIQQIASPDELFAQPANAWLAEFIDAGNLLSGPPTVQPNGNWSAKLSDTIEFSAPMQKGVEQKTASLLIPQHQLQVTLATSPTPFKISHLKPSGLTTTADIRWEAGYLRAQLSAEDALCLSVGASVHLAAAPGAGLWLAGD